MEILEKNVSAGGQGIFELDEFLSRPLFAHLAHSGLDGPRESPVWFHWDGEAIWIIGGSSFSENLKRNPCCALGIVDWNLKTGMLHHVGIRGRAEVLPFDPSMAKTIFHRYFGPSEDRWDRRFDDVFDGTTVAQMVRVLPAQVVMRDQSYQPGR